MRLSLPPAEMKRASRGREGSARLTRWRAIASAADAVIGSCRTVRPAMGTKRRARSDRDRRGSSWPGTSIVRARASKKACRSAVGFLLSLFHEPTAGTPGAVPGSMRRSRSSEKRSIRAKPFDSEVPPLNLVSSPVWCRDQRACRHPVVLLDQRRRNPGLFRDDRDQAWEVPILVDEVQCRAAA